MATTSCANCNTTTTESHPLKLYGACKTVGFCNRACQKANWKAHKPAYHQSRVAGDKDANDQATLHNINETIASLEASAEQPFGFDLSEAFTVPEGSCYIRLPSTPELPRGAYRLVHFPAEFLAEISHLSQEEQENAKNDFVDDMLATEEAHMTPEMREEKRLEDAKEGRLQAEFFKRLAMKEARDAEGR